VVFSEQLREFYVYDDFMIWKTLYLE
jgi:hypothetical protein